MPSKRIFSSLIVTAVVISSLLIISKSYSQPTSWDNTLTVGKNQPVYFHAWGGDPQINAYITWLATQVKASYNIDLVHVKLTDTSDAVSRVLAEKSAGDHHQGQIDLIWINGANFAAMAKNKLLMPDWAFALPNFALTNPDENPAMSRDFSLPTQGMEAPWGQAALTFYYDSLATTAPPKTLTELLSWSKQNPGRFSYPKPPDFLGVSFLKYALLVLNKDTPAQQLLYQPATAASQALLLPKLWQFLDKLHPHLWRSGRHFVSSGVTLRRLVGDTELSLAFTFSAPEVPGAVERFDLPRSIRSYAMADGSLSNIHFVAIPYNAAHQASAQLVANFMLSVKAQAKKQQATIWGDRTVLDLSVLSPSEQAQFSPAKPHPSALPSNHKSPSLSEPHPSWSSALTRQWLTRYGVQ